MRVLSTAVKNGQQTKCTFINILPTYTELLLQQYLYRVSKRLIVNDGAPKIAKRYYKGYCTCVSGWSQVELTGYRGGYAKKIWWCKVTARLCKEWDVTGKDLMNGRWSLRQKRGKQPRKNENEENGGEKWDDRANKVQKRVERKVFDMIFGLKERKQEREIK